MSKYYVTQDIKRCIGCKACEVHCKDKNKVSGNAFFCKMVQTGTRAVNNIPITDFVYMACFHCEQPWCVAACPTGAMQRRHTDGIVFVNKDLCVGCKSCMTACPWGVPQWDAETGKVGKCDLCKDRVDQGKKPACVTKCTTGCLDFIDPENASEEKRQRYAEKLLRHKA